MDGSLFISYSHLDTAWMQRVKKHLEGMLHGRCKVWTDEDIAAGSTWQDTLLGNLRQAAAGLVLVSPDYLVSPWCRKELAQLAEARRNRQLAAVYWILLEPCGWQWSELAELQAVQEPATQAASALPDGPERSRHLLRCCETVATSLLPLLDREDPALGAVRAILARSKAGAMVTPISALNEGDFSIVCRGIYANGDDVVIKVLTNTPLHRMRELFFEVSRACSRVTVPSVIRTTEVFTDGQGYEQRIVLFSELARGDPLADTMAADAALPRAERHLQPDVAVVVLRRVAEALHALHRLPPIEWSGGPPYRHLMGPLVPKNIFYDAATQRPQLSLVGVTNFLWHFFEADTFRHIVGPKHGTYLLPEKLAGATPDVRADQYFLGMLALELMAGRPLFLVGEHEQPEDPLAILARAPWADRHQQFGRLVARLLQPDPDRRFQGRTAIDAAAPMREAMDALRALEGSARALAKHSYNHCIAVARDGLPPGVAFAQAFYADFFERSPSARALFEREHAARGGAPGATLPDLVHHHKLMEGLKAVLNFRPGGTPSAIDSLVAQHRRLAVGALQLADFEDSFIVTLDRQLAACGEDDEDRAEIVAAWQQLFAPVRSEMGPRGE
jgi:hypothetical protein